MDTPVLISHKTAWLVHHVPQNLVQSLARHDYQIGARGISTQQRVARIRQALTDCGIPSDMLKTIDISVVFEFERIRTKGVICHILGQNLPYEHIDELTPGIFGSPEPSETALRVSDTELSRPDAFALIPALAYDREGYRLGYGKGDYDRFLSGFGGTSAGIFYSDLLFNQLPRGFFDRKVSLLVSDRGVILPDA